MEFDTFDCITKVEHVQLVQLCLTRQENGGIFVEHTFDKTFDKDELASTLATKSDSTRSTLSTVDTVERVEFDFVTSIHDWA